MGPKCSRALCGSLVALFAGMVAPAGAATFTYNLTGNPASIVTVVPPDQSFPRLTVVPLTDADTGSSQLPGVLTVSVGDTINVNLTFANDFTVPQTGPGWLPLLTLWLQQMPAALDSVVVSNTVTYYRDGAQVAAPYVGPVVSNGVLALESALPTETATASFSVRPDRLQQPDR